MRESDREILAKQAVRSGCSGGGVCRKHAAQAAVVVIDLGQLGVAAKAAH